MDNERRSYPEAKDRIEKKQKLAPGCDVEKESSVQDLRRSTSPSSSSSSADSGVSTSSNRKKRNLSLEYAESLPKSLSEDVKLHGKYRGWQDRISADKDFYDFFDSCKASYANTFVHLIRFSRNLPAHFWNLKRKKFRNSFSTSRFSELRSDMERKFVQIFPEFYVDIYSRIPLPECPLVGIGALFSSWKKLKFEDESLESLPQSSSPAQSPPHSSSPAQSPPHSSSPTRHILRRGAVILPKFRRGRSDVERW